LTQLSTLYTFLFWLRIPSKDLGASLNLIPISKSRSKKERKKGWRERERERVGGEGEGRGGEGVVFE
jgi:hypothetical protein